MTAVELLPCVVLAGRGVTPSGVGSLVVEAMLARAAEMCHACPGCWMDLGKAVAIAWDGEGIARRWPDNVPVMWRAAEGLGPRRVAWWWRRPGRAPASGHPQALLLLAPAALLLDAPDMGALVRRAMREGVACGVGGARALAAAVALRPHSRPPDVRVVLSAVAAAATAPAGVGCVAVGAPEVFAPALAPAAVNTAAAELCTMPADRGDVGGDAMRLRDALIAQRHRSAVPWVFNELANEVEWRTGCATPRSFPPEAHLSVTGLCNIECRFCSYAHDDAKRDVVTPEMVRQLTFLRHARTLRLHSGNGEPTVNRHLPEILWTCTQRSITCP